MPRTKFRSLRHKRRTAPLQPYRHMPASSKSSGSSDTASSNLPIASPSSTIASPSTATSLTTATTTAPITATEKKLNRSPHTTCDYSSSESEGETFDERECEGKGVRMLEVAGLQSVLGAVSCKECGSGPILFREDMSRRNGVCTYPYLYCENCSKVRSIPFSTVGTSKVLAINRRTVLANKCAGGSHSGLEFLFSMLDLPPPVSRNILQAHGCHMPSNYHGSARQLDESLGGGTSTLRRFIKRRSCRYFSELRWNVAETRFFISVWCCFHHSL